MQCTRPVDSWTGMGGMDSQYKLLSELLSHQAAFITSPKTSLANYWGGIAPLPPPQCLRACVLVVIAGINIPVRLSFVDMINYVFIAFKMPCDTDHCSKTQYQRVAYWWITLLPILALLPHSKYVVFSWMSRMKVRIWSPRKIGGVSMRFFLEMISDDAPKGKTNINDMTTFEIVKIMSQTAAAGNTSSFWATDRSL